MLSLPIFLDLSRGRIIVAGSTPLARAKLEVLCARGAVITWFPVTLGREDAAMLIPVSHDENFEINDGEPADSDLTGAIVVIAAAGEGSDQRIARRARKAVSKATPTALSE